MSATVSPAQRPAATVDGVGKLRPGTPWRGEPEPPRATQLERHNLRRRLRTALVLGICAATALVAVPDLRPVLREITAMNPALVLVAVALELASCLSFVVIFRLFFSPVPDAMAREMAWSQMGAGALLPGGGVGSLAVGGWWLHLAGMPTRQIVRRSSGLFFLTSAINVIMLGVAGLVLLLGISGGLGDVLRAGVPVVAALAAITLVLALPKVARRIARRRPNSAWLDDLGAGIPAARDALLRPHRRLLGAFGYLLLTSLSCGRRWLRSVGCPQWRRS